LPLFYKNSYALKVKKIFVTFNLRGKNARQLNSTQLNRKLILSSLFLLLPLASITSAHADNNIVVNGTFNGTANWALNGFSPSSLSATNDGSGSVETGAVYNSNISPIPYPASGANISQALNTSVGTTYTLTFNVAENAGPTSGISVYWNGVDVFNALNPANNVTPYNNYGGWVTETVTGLFALTSSTTLEIAGYQNPREIWLDNISVTSSAVPEPEMVSMFAIGLLGLGLARKKAIQA
jgi:hypothetical protein